MADVQTSEVDTKLESVNEETLRVKFGNMETNHSRVTDKPIYMQQSWTQYVTTETVVVNVTMEWR
jgi:hypothetical protein